MSVHTTVLQDGSADKNDYPTCMPIFSPLNIDFDFMEHPKRLKKGGDVFLTVFGERERG